MNADKYKKNIIRWMSYLEDAKDYLLANNKSIDAQNHIKYDKRYNGYLIELESPQTGGTTADWIRLNYEDCYMYIKNNSIEYEFDPFGYYGTEIINVNSYQKFIDEVIGLSDIDQYEEV